MPSFRDRAKRLLKRRKTSLPGSSILNPPLTATIQPVDLNTVSTSTSNEVIGNDALLLCADTNPTLASTLKPRDRWAKYTPFRKPPALSEYAQQEIVALTVGRSKTPFLIHKGLFQDQSSYFATRLKHCWNADSTIDFDLPHIQAAPFRIIIDWLYTGKLPDTIEDIEPEITDGVVESNTTDDINPMSKTIIPFDAKATDNPTAKDAAPSTDNNKVTNPKKTVQLWIHIPLIYHTADLLMMTALQNYIVDLDLADHRESQSVWKIASIEDFHEFDITHTPYYQLFLDSCVRSLCRSPVSEALMEKLLDTLEEKCPRAVRDVLARMNRWQRAPWEEVHRGDWCRYHIHGGRGRCERM